MLFGSAIRNPAARFQTLLQREIERQGGNVRMGVTPPVVTQTGAETNVVVLHEESSAPMHALLSLANTESHNFTAEVLLREAADQWDLSQASVSAMQWMRAQNLPTAGLRVADGSGLSRGNRVTSRTLAALLLRMNQHPLSAYYRSSMAIAGQRGHCGTTSAAAVWRVVFTAKQARSQACVLFRESFRPKMVSDL